MTNKDFGHLAQFILERNPYFQNGYGLAVKETDEDIIRIGETSLFPNDRLGNYFFMLSDGRVSINNLSKMNDCGRELSFMDALTVKVVAVVDNADEWLLANNLLNTVTVFGGGFNATPSRASVNRAIVTREVMSGFSSETINRVLARWGNEAVVSIDMTIRKPGILNGCIVDVCKTC